MSKRSISFSTDLAPRQAQHGSDHSHAWDDSAQTKQRERLEDSPNHIRKVHAESGHNLGTSDHGIHMNTERSGSAVAQRTVALAPRLLDLHTAALYLGVSEWTVRDLEAARVLPRVRIPLPNHGELRKLLFDVRELDRLIDCWKDTTP